MGILYTIFLLGHNLALGRPSLQSSTLWGYDPGLAVDGDPDTCSFTPRSSELRWWQVHLAGAEGGDGPGQSVVIESVAVTVSPGTYQRFTIFVIGEFCFQYLVIFYMPMYR